MTTAKDFIRGVRDTEARRLRLKREEDRIRTLARRAAEEGDTMDCDGEPVHGPGGDPDFYDEEAAADAEADAIDRAYERARDEGRLPE